MPDVLFLPECYADTALINLLAPANTRIDHIFGIRNVVQEMKSIAENRPNFTVVGIIDNDKRSPAYFDDFVLIDQFEKITFKKRSDTNQYLITLDKAIETFLLWNAGKINLDITQYGFPTNLKQFCKAVKRTTIGYDPNYLQLLTDLHTRQAPGFITLENILNDFLTP